jgi:hypothetical protein
MVVFNFQLGQKLTMYIWLATLCCVKYCMKIVTMCLMRFISVQRKFSFFFKNSDIKKNGSMEKNVTMYSAMSMRNVDHCDFWSKKLLIIFQHN